MEGKPILDIKQARERAIAVCLDAKNEPHFYESDQLFLSWLINAPLQQELSISDKDLIDILACNFDKVVMFCQTCQKISIFYVNMYASDETLGLMNMVTELQSDGVAYAKTAVWNFDVSFTCPVCNEAHDVTVAIMDGKMKKRFQCRFAGAQNEES